jgi:hypothetical protein
METSAGRLGTGRFSPPMPGPPRHFLRNRKLGFYGTVTTGGVPVFELRDELGPSFPAEYFAEINADPVVFRWNYKMDEIVMDMFALEEWRKHFGAVCGEGQYPKTFQLRGQVANGTEIGQPHRAPMPHR